MVGRPVKNDNPVYLIVEHAVNRLTEAKVLEGSYSVKDHGDGTVEIGAPATLRQPIMHVVLEGAHMYGKTPEGKPLVKIDQGWHAPGAIGEGWFLILKDTRPTPVVRIWSMD
jgi:hypothetical protein